MDNIIYFGGRILYYCNDSRLHHKEKINERTYCINLPNLI